MIKCLMGLLLDVMDVEFALNNPINYTPKTLEDARLRQTSEGPEHSSVIGLSESRQDPRSFKGD